MNYRALKSHCKVQSEDVSLPRDSEVRQSSPRERTPLPSLSSSSHCRETRWRWREHSPSHRQSVSVSVVETRLPGTLQLWSLLCIYGLPHCASENHLLQIGTEPLPTLSDRGATGLSNVFILEILLSAWSKTGLSKDCNPRPLQRPGVTTLITPVSPRCV